MDRSKTLRGGGKGKAPVCPSDLYVLGPKGASRSEKTDPKRAASITSKSLPGASSAHSLTDRRKLSSSTSAATCAPVPKKQKTSALQPGTSYDPSKPWEDSAADVDPAYLRAHLVTSVLEAKDNDETDKVSLLCGAFKILRSSRIKTDSTLCKDLLEIAKIQPTLFSNDTVVDALCSILRREATTFIYKSKVNISNIVLIINLLYHGFRNVKCWPDILIKIYMEDSVGERLWVDNEHCKCFTDNIMASVHTRPSSASDNETVMKPDDIDEKLREELSKDKSYSVSARYNDCQDSIENLVIEFCKDHLNRRQTIEGINKNLLKFLANICGITEIRAITASKLEMWLQSPKLMKTAQELLMALCINCTSNTQQDVEIVCNIVKIRLKTKALSASYLACIRELISAHDKNLPIVLKQIVQNELSVSRNSNNMPMLQSVFQSYPKKCAEILAEIFLEIMCNGDDNLKSLRSVLREMARVLRADLSISVFCRALMSQAAAADSSLPVTAADLQCKDRLFASIVDLVTLSIFLCIVPYARSDRRADIHMEKLQEMICRIQSDIMKWFYETSDGSLCKPSPSDFLHALHKVMFTDTAAAADQYYRMDNWPPEQDRLLFVRYATEVPLPQTIVHRILYMGIDKRYPITAYDAIDFVECLVKRAASIHLSVANLSADKTEIVDLLFNLCAFHLPDEQELVVGGISCPATQLAVGSMYWKSWIVLLIYCAHVPTVFGSLAWEGYPMLRVFIEMCITNHFVYPQSNAEELQLQQVEKQAIAELEAYLSSYSKMGASEINSLICQLVLLKPSGAARRPPMAVLEQLQSLNYTHKLGNLLCRSRNPDFLLHIMLKQGASQSMPWLADLVQKSEGSFDHLPVQCLCEFLLSSTEKQEMYQELVVYLQAFLTDPLKEHAAKVSDMLNYFLQRLSSRCDKQQPISSLKLLLSTVKEAGADCCEINDCWPYGEQCMRIFNKLAALPHFESIKPQIIRTLREACQVENDADMIRPYLNFLAKYAAAKETAASEMAELVMDLAQLVVERSIIMAVVLPSSPIDHSDFQVEAFDSLLKIFYTFLKKIRQSGKNEFASLEVEEQTVTVTWPSGSEQQVAAAAAAALPLLVYHSIIILLSYGCSYANNKDRSNKHVIRFNRLLDIWFPLQKHLKPKIYSACSSEEVLIPDWLKLKMIRSKIPRLMDDALSDLSPSQLLLFIQSFGNPVSSVSALLQALDDAVAKNRLVGENLVIDKLCVIQILQAQRRRGVVAGGALFEQYLKSSFDTTMAASPPPPDRCGDTDQDISTAMDTTDAAAVDDCAMNEANDELSMEEVELIVKSLHLEQFSISVDVRDKRQRLLRMISKELMNVRASTAGCCSSSHPDTRISNKLFSLMLRRCSSDAAYVMGLIRNYQFSCRLFRLITTTNHKEHITLLLIIGKAILAQSRLVDQNDPTTTRNPLVSLLKPFITSNTSTFIHQQNKYAVASAATASKFLQLTTEDTLQILKSSSTECIEVASCQLLECERFKIDGHKMFIECLAQLVQSDLNANNNGLFIDLLIQIEPEIIGSSIDLQMEILFSRDDKWKYARRCRPYLLTLLTHHASWFTLEKALMALLTLNSTTRFDPSSVLDFLWALACNPKLWQGLEATTPKHLPPENMLRRLSQQQLVSLVEYIILEVELTGSDGSSSFKVQLSEEEEYVSSYDTNKMNNRLSQLIERTIQDDHAQHTTIDAVIDYLKKSCCASQKRNNICRYLMVQLYIRIPSLITKLRKDPFCRKLHDISASGGGHTSSLLDTMSHTVLTSLTTNVHDSDWLKRHHDLELIIRKMASSHPLLFLRQLDVIRVSLAGRVHLNWNVFKSHNYYALYMLMFSILNMLKPHLFLAEFSEPFHGILDSYLDAFKSYRTEREISVAMLKRFVPLIQSYINYDTDRAVTYLQSKASLLRELLNDFPNLGGLCVMMSNEKDGFSGQSNSAIVVTSTWNSNEISSAQFDAIINSLKYNDSANAVQELERTSLRKPALLEPVLEQLFPYLEHSASFIRSMVHTMVARCAKYNPASAKRALPHILNCLHSDDPTIITSTLDTLPEIIVCSQEDSVPILRKLFLLGLTRNYNTLPCINRIISLLNLQSSC